MHLREGFIYSTQAHLRGGSIITNRYGIVNGGNTLTYQKYS